MLVVFGLLIFTTISNEAKPNGIDSVDSRPNQISLDEFPEKLVTTSGNVNVTNNEIKDESDDPLTYDWDTFVAVLLKVSIERIEKVKTNIRNYYDLREPETKAVNDAFDYAHAEYEQFLQFNLKKSVEKKTFNTSLEYMLDFMDLSNYLLTQIVEYNLAKVKGRLDLATKWYKQSMRQKIVRQQNKIATNNIESHICFELKICKDRQLYSQYLIEWIRHFMDLSTSNMKKLFSVVPDILEKNMHSLKSNMKFKKTVKMIYNGSEMAQRDTLDYVDEVLTDKKNIVYLVPETLKKGASLLTNLFTLIDENYIISEDNLEKLENISELIYDFNGGKDVNVTAILEEILQNMLLNVKIFKMDVQRKLDVIWSQIILL